MDAPAPRSSPGGGARFADVRWVDETGSTNDDLLAAARAGDPERVLVADRQTAGRGRLGRRWEAPPGASLLCSILVRPELPLAKAHLVPWAVALAALDAIAEVTGVELRLKWPNDLVAVGHTTDGGDAKVAGLLSELVSDGEQLLAVVVGVGINLNWGSAFPPELAVRAASLDALAGASVDRDAVLDAMLCRLREHLAAGQPAPILADRLHRAVVARSATVGRGVRVELPGEELVGQAVEITESGALVVEIEGTRHVVHVGDVVHARLARS